MLGNLDSFLLRVIGSVLYSKLSRYLWKVRGWVGNVRLNLREIRRGKRNFETKVITQYRLIANTSDCAEELLKRMFYPIITS